MTDRSAPPSINMSAIRVAGVGGLGMVAMVVVIAFALPLAFWLLVSGIVAGAVLAAALIVRRRAHELGAPDDDLPQGLALVGRGGQRSSASRSRAPGGILPKQQLAVS